MRLFVAVNLRPEEKRLAHRSARRLESAAEKGRFTSWENLHITLVFLGETRRETAVRRAMEAVRAQPFSLRLSGLGRFAKQGGDVVWMGIDESAELAALQRQLAGELAAEGFPVEDRPYRPHLTLGRQVRVSGAALEELSSQAEPVELWVDRISLMHSHQVDGRLTYSEIGVRKLHLHG